MKTKLLGFVFGVILLMMVAMMTLAGRASAQGEEPWDEGYPVETPEPIQYEWPPEEGCIRHDWMGICVEWEESEPAAAAQPKWVDPPAVVQQVKQVIKPTIMEIIEGLKLAFRMK